MRRALTAAATLLHRRSPVVFISTSASPLSPPPPLEPSAFLTDVELAEIRLLVRRLCESDRHDAAVRLITTALLADPPLDALPIASLADRLSSLPDMVAAMSLLTALRYHPRHPSPIPFCYSLISSYFQNSRPKEAAKVLSWLFRSDTPCRPDAEVYRISVEGFCRLGRMLDALIAVKEMVSDRITPASETRVTIYRGLLQQARVDEAQELDPALMVIEQSGEGFGDVLKLLDRIIKNWE
ncbi:pentatricopeptide repeat-containing protein At1g52620-like isoform X1 [Zingiber officinale]|uniref:Pentatricopeptide repeat-containing protein n=1 Tax=Zingiber officinale TaxID=94328 RepID=A0A8J5G3F9_ZINOF|nr:pentatricopeptide repeat-containing protein At1g52620-like isoform X1 [Zingiber officinale]XP_042405587.1 pentatricopeptide repeat-containing protein At1g52620-like isoform X1 [Zingiber officinale]KAG6498916.1 hypothetical protein ZIOFF_038669 [Zingiber officinale]